jgi:serine/threonine protein kinase
VKACPEDATPLQADATVADNNLLGAQTIMHSDPMIGRVFDAKYRLDERLGQGGMGTVYRATHLLIERPVAVKVLNPRFVEDEAAQERFRREARAAGRLQHLNAVTVTDFGQTTDGYVYIVMELLEGRTLRDVLARESPLDTARAVSIMLQVAAAVSAAHEAGVIHRDLKPANIFITQRKNTPPVIKVLDFGIAKLAAEAIDEEEHQMTLTQVGAMIGTPRYMSPEQCDGAKLTPAADVYSLGIILYEMLTGVTPFNGTTPLAVALKHSSVTPQPLTELVASVPKPLEELVLHTLAKKPEDRPADAGEFRRALYEVAQSLGLEHAAGFTAPTFEALRNAGNETPSGRLVIDIERLRESRASTNRNTSSIDGAVTGEDHSAELSAAPSTAVASAAMLQDRDSAVASPLDAPHEVVAPVVLGNDPPPTISRFKISLNQKPAGPGVFQRPLTLFGIGIGALLLAAAVGVGLSRSRTPGQLLPVDKSEVPLSQLVAQGEEFLAQDDEGGNSSGRQGRNGTRDSRHAGNNGTTRAAQQPEKKPSKIGSIVNKVKKIFKNPF